MPRRGKQKAERKRDLTQHFKDTLVQVGFDDAETQDLDALVEQEIVLRRDSKLGRATIVREHAMPSIRQRLAELKTLEPAGAQ